MIRILAAAICISLLLGCATSQRYEEMLNTWVGKNEEELVRSWGPPSSVYDSGRSKFLTYARSAQGYVPGAAPSYRGYVIGNTVYTRPIGGSPGYAYTQQCVTSFETVGGVIRSWRWEGNACIAR